MRGITANRVHLLDQVKNSISIVTDLNPYIGYERATKALATGGGIYDIVLSGDLITKAQPDELLHPEALTQPTLFQVAKLAPVSQAEPYLPLRSAHCR